MHYENILVLGGGGFVGRHLVAALAAQGARVTVPSRRRERAKHLLLLPTVDVVECDVNRREALSALVAGRDAVVNLVGILHGPDFARAHVELPQAVVAACREHGVRRVLHMSALGASPGAPSEYLRSKGAGEQAVLAADDLNVTVFRPSVVFGPEDAFLNLFAMLAKLMPVLLLACPEARFQPVYVRDVARVMVEALGESKSFGQAYDLCGPKVYALRELVQTVCRLTGRRRLVLGLPDSLAYLQALLLELAPGEPLMTRDNLRSMQVPSVCDCSLPFGVEPQALEALAPGWLAPSGSRQRYPVFRWRARR
ncbi:MAG TPA: complex I NDUFA9 subunit family protein [Burkholderiales bacterium]|nr:complex I NDUFA9 subunit family protein [Burkholderiales bacterium]